MFTNKLQFRYDILQNLLQLSFAITNSSQPSASSFHFEGPSWVPRDAARQLRVSWGVALSIFHVSLFNHQYSTKWWDPIAATCLCTSSHCEYKDTAVVIDTKDGGADGSSSAAGSASKNGVAHGRSQSSDTVRTVAKVEVGLMVLMILYGWM